MTIRLRLALIYVGAIVITVGLVGALIWWQLGSALRTSLDQSLETRASAILASFENQGQAGLQDSGPPSPGVFVVILDAHGATVDATASVPAGLTPPPAGAADTTVKLDSTSYALHTVAGDTGLRVVAGSDLSPIQRTLDRLAGSLLAVGALAALVSLLGGWWLAGRALRPVALITAEASQIGAADIERRLPVPARHDEMRALATTLNGMLDRVSDSLRRQRAFVAAASHDLRTPIAALQTELELAEDARTSGPELRAAVQAAHADAVRLGELATALLDLAAAGADGRALVRSQVRTDTLLESVARRVEPLARDHDTRVTREAPARLLRVDRVRLEQALTNLVVNAITYSPRGADVDLIATFEPSEPDGAGAAGALLSIEVLDRGRGVPPDFEHRVFEPFDRGPNAIGPGTGLGLATAAAAIRAHHGSIGFEPRTGGGTRFWIQLPV
ncbi:MAG TPA: ATP-binding protein [Candidatus Limnocylindrales bacterium]|nr:ATP-binding protein [Candidatus Limnocylindrales bacterium]